MCAPTWELVHIWRAAEYCFPSPVVMQAATECGVSCFSYSACREVKRYGKVLVMVDELGEPALDVGLEIGVGKGRLLFGGVRLRKVKAWLRMWRALLRPGSSRLVAMRRMA